VARPREFDESVVLDRALRAFWERGYDATSVDDLVAATGLGRASLYGAFGDKEQFFRRVVDHYAARSRNEVDRVLAGLSGRAALEAFLLSRVNGSACFATTPGCFLQIAATSGTSPPLVQEALIEGQREVNEILMRSLKEARCLGELRATADLEKLSALLGVVVSGLTASAKAGASEPALSLAVHETMALIFEAP